MKSVKFLQHINLSKIYIRENSLSFILPIQLLWDPSTNGRVRYLFSSKKGSRPVLYWSLVINKHKPVNTLGQARSGSILLGLACSVSASIS